MLNFLCLRCNNSFRDEQIANIDLKTQPNHRNNIPIAKSKAIPTSSLRNQNTQTVVNTSEISNDNIDELIIIDYPFEPTPFNQMAKKVMKVDSNLHKAVSPAYIPKIASSDLGDRGDLDYTLIDDLSEDKVQDKPQPSLIKEKCCIYCEEIYKEAFINGFIIQEKQCIYCNKMISQETFETLINEGMFNKIKEDESLIIKARSAKRMKVASSTSDIKANNCCRTETKASMPRAFDGNIKKDKKTKINNIISNNSNHINNSKKNNGTNNTNMKNSTLLNTKLMKMKTLGNLRVQKKI